MYDDSRNWLNGGALLLLLFTKIEIVFSVYVFFFNANVFLNDYFDSPYWLFTTVFLLFSVFITCVIRCICQCWQLCTMYTFEIKFVLFWSAIISVETVNILRPNMLYSNFINMLSFGLYCGITPLNHLHIPFYLEAFHNLC